MVGEDLVQYDDWPVMTLKQFLTIVKRLSIIKAATKGDRPLNEIIESRFGQKIFREVLLWRS